MAIATINPATGETLKTFDPLSGAEIEDRLERASQALRPIDARACRTGSVGCAPRLMSSTPTSSTWPR
jgi:hypothetical protein